MAQGLLGELSNAAFLHRHWQKRPLFVRDAIPDCGGWLTPDGLFALAMRDDVESRLVIRTRNGWTLQQGPFRRAQLRGLPERNWTLLVQGVDQVNAEAAALLQLFSFIPHARLDDLMVSYAPPGGGVGPHFDSYDVFLLQGTGARRWRISAQKDFELVDHAPLRILKRFRHTREWHARQGDLLYLPPRYAHEGVAQESPETQEACMTLSVGFRAPRKQELATRFLEFLQDELDLPGLYEDRNLQTQLHPAQLPPAMLEKFAHVLKSIRWHDRDIRKFSGCYLTEPKPLTVFRPPRRPAALPLFARQVAAKGLCLALPTRMLFSGGQLFVNGECHPLTHDRAALVRLADRRSAPAFTPTDTTARLLHLWYRAGYIELGTTE
jgi:50S ribosomal protein L16 3-hydroxylase